MPKTTSTPPPPNPKFRVLIAIAVLSAVGAILCAFAPPVMGWKGDLTMINSLALTFGVVFTGCVSAITIEALR